jgi:HEAT repeat protein
VETEDTRANSIALLACLAEPASVPALRRLLLDRRESKWEREHIVEALSRLGATLPVEELKELLDDRTLWDGPHHGDLCYLLVLFRSEEAQRIAREFLMQMSARDRAEMLWFCAEKSRWPLAHDPVAPELVDWLYEQWLQQDRFLLGDDGDDDGPSNVRVAAATRERPASQALLLDFWRQASAEQRQELLTHLWDDDDEGFPVALLNQHPAELPELAGALALRPPDLHLYYGADVLLGMIEGMIREAGQARDLERSSEGRWEEPIREAKLALQEWFLYQELCLKRALYLLESWPNPHRNDRVAALFCCPDLKSIRRDLFDFLWTHDRDRVAAYVFSVTKRQRDHSIAGTALEWMAVDPCAADRELLLWAITRRTTEFRYLAIQGLEKLGEDNSLWRQRLEELTRDSSPFVRLHATGALARRGDTAGLAEILREAREAKDVCVRAEAMRVLGEIDAKAHFKLLRHTLLDDHQEDSMYFPAAEEAGLALAHLGTPEAMSALIRAYVVAPGSLWSSLATYLDTIARRLEGHDEPIQPYEFGWRRRRPWRRERLQT